MTMEYLPLFINLKNRPVLVVGGGSVATRKIKILKLTGAIIKIVANELCLELKKMVFIHEIEWLGKVFKPVMLNKVILVVVATNDVSLNSLVYNYANERHVLINTVDNLSKCSCIFPAIVDRNPILIGISSGGKSPVLVRMLREKLELLFPASIGLIAQLAGEWRDRVKKCIKSVLYRRRFWEMFYNTQISMFMENNQKEKVNKILEDALNKKVFYQKKGDVTLVGAGPGDKGLLTIRGLQVIQKADVILYDHLVSLEILELARRDARKICVGKRAGKFSISQDKINNLIVQLAEQGNRVVRLKGGDSFIFGRGGEELQVVSEAGIPFQVVPGITAGIGAAAYSGIPLTHRKYAHSVIFITGYMSCSDNYKLNWNVLSDNKQTLVIYMGMFNAKNISANLIFFGRHENTPVAVISRGTYKNQTILIGILMELDQLIQTAEYPTILIIGDVVFLHKKISWFGKTIFSNKFNLISKGW